jgi:hypothetical protein
VELCGLAGHRGVRDQAKRTVPTCADGLHGLAKVRVASSNLVIRSIEAPCLQGASCFVAGGRHCSDLAGQLVFRHDETDWAIDPINLMRAWGEHTAVLFARVLYR